MKRTGYAFSASKQLGTRQEKIMVIIFFKSGMH